MSRQVGLHHFYALQFLQAELCTEDRQHFRRRREHLALLRRGGVRNVCTSHFLRCCLGLEPAVFICSIHGPNGTSLTSTSRRTSATAASLGCTGTARTDWTSGALRASKRQKLHSCVLRYCTSSGTPRCQSTATQHFRQHSIHRSPGPFFIW